MKVDVNYHESETFCHDELDDIHVNNSEYIDCTFENVDFTEFDLISCKFIECRFSKCNLSNAKINYSTFRDVKFFDCKLIGVNWSVVQSASELHFEDCILDFNVFNNMKLPNSCFRNCSLKNADLSEAIFTKTFFDNSNLLDCSFNNSNLEEARFIDAKNYYIDMKSSKLKKAKFSFPDAIVLLEAQGIIIDR